MLIIFEDKLFYRLLALFVLFVFYSFYLYKQFKLQNKGIKVIQMGKAKKNDVETLMGIATVGIIIAQAMSIVFNFNHSSNVVRIIGFFIALIGDFIFLKATIDMKDSWRVGVPENTKTILITKGIYSYSRNPAFLGFDLQYLGVFMMFNNLLTLSFTIFASVMLHKQILEEEKYLKKTFGKEYEDYCRNVPGRYICLFK